MERSILTVSLASSTNAINPETKSQWVHLFTHGDMIARDGRKFSLAHADQVVALSMQRAGKTDLPIDYEHQSFHAKENGQPAPAAGWIKKFDVRQDGLWAFVQWTDIAASMIEQKQYRYISPEFAADKSGKIRYITAAGLTNKPALELTQLASNDMDDKHEGENMTFSEQIAAILGMPKDTDEDQILTSLIVNSKIKIDEISSVRTVITNLNEERIQIHTARINDKVKGAISTGVVPPSMKDWMTKLCTQDEEAFDEFITKVGKPFGDLFIENPHLKKLETAKLQSGTEITTAEQKVATQLGLNPKDMCS